MALRRKRHSAFSVGFACLPTLLARRFSERTYQAPRLDNALMIATKCIPSSRCAVNALYSSFDLTARSLESYRVILSSLIKKILNKNLKNGKYAVASWLL